MKKKEQKNIDDLIQDLSFRKWAIENESDTYWEEFAIQSSYNAKIVEGARSFLKSFYYLESKVSESETEDQLLNLQTKLNMSPKHRFNKSLLFALASFCLVIFSGILIISNTEETISDDLVSADAIGEGLIEQINNTNSVKLITLSDGSSVLLQPKSKLSYSKEFDLYDREVFLSGEAFFEVSKDLVKPFSVYSNEVITNVHGTSFRVIAYDEQDEVKVLVKSGKVKVRKSEIKRDEDLNEITLLPNQAASYNKNDDTFKNISEIDIEAIEELESIDNQSFDFINVPVKEVFSTLQDIYNLRLIYPEEALKGCYITTSLSDVPLPEKLKIICFSIGNDTAYELVGDKIIITSNGCE